MIVQNNFSVSRTDFHQNMEVSVNGYSFVIVEMLPTEAGKGKQYRGVLTCPDGSNKSFIDRPVFVTKLNEIAGAKGVKVATKKEASHHTNESKVIKVTNLSEERIDELVSFHHADLQKRFSKLVSNTLVSHEDLHRVFIDYVNRSTRSLRDRLEDKLRKQREELLIAKKSEAKKSILARVERLRNYIATYDTAVCNMLLQDKEAAMIMLLDKDAKIAKAQSIIAKYA